MRSALRWRHYCDYCKKSTGTKPSMIKHEAGCTANPNRVCGMCDVIGEVQVPIAELMQAYVAGFKELANAANNCPACMLAAQRQFWSNPENMSAYNDQRFMNRDEGGDWDFREAVKEFWRDHNEANSPGYC